MHVSFETLGVSADNMEGIGLAVVQAAGWSGLGESTVYRLHHIYDDGPMELPHALTCPILLYLPDDESSRKRDYFRFEGMDPLVLELI